VKRKRKKLLMEITEGGETIHYYDDHTYRFDSYDKGDYSWWKIVGDKMFFRHYPRKGHWTEDGLITDVNLERLKSAIVEKAIFCEKKKKT